MNKFRNYALTQSTDELKKLILENPDLPIAVLAGEDANSGWSGYMFCTSISFSIGEILDCDFYYYDDGVFTDRDELEEYIIDILSDEYPDVSDEEFDAIVRKEVEKYEPYWQKAIMIYADN